MYVTAIKNVALVAGGVLATPEVAVGTTLISIGLVGKQVYDYLKSRS